MIFLRMDSESLKILLSTQEQSYRSAMELFFNQLNAKMEKTQKTVAELTRSLEFSQAEIVELKNEIVELKKTKTSFEDSIKSLTVDLGSSSKTVSELEDRCNYQEDYSRRNNLQIVGLDENQGGETWEQTASKVSKLLEEKLELPGVQMERAHRVGRGMDRGPRPIIARFARFQDREAARRNAVKLRGTNVFFNEDLCKASQEIRKAKLPLLKQARSEGKIAYFSHTKLVIREHQPRVSVSANGDSSSQAKVVIGRNIQESGNVTVTGGHGAEPEASGSGSGGSQRKSSLRPIRK